MQYAYSYRQNDNFNATTGLTAEQCNYKLLIQKLNRESLHALTCTLLQAIHDEEGSMCMSGSRLTMETHNYYINELLCMDQVGMQ